MKRKCTTKKRTILIDGLEFEKTILKEKNRVEKHHFNWWLRVAKMHTIKRKGTNKKHTILIDGGIMKIFQGMKEVWSKMRTQHDE